VKLSDLSYGGHIKAILKRNNMPADSLVSLLNREIRSSITRRYPESVVIILPDSLSDEIRRTGIKIEFPTSAHLNELNKLKGFKKVMAANDARNEFKYTGLSVPDSLIVALKLWMRETDVEKLILFTEIQMKQFWAGSGNSYFMFDYEVYAGDMSKSIGGKAGYNYTLSRKIYFNAFEYYLKRIIIRVVEKIYQEETLRVAGSGR
jgi:hypothetical protein